MKSLGAVAILGLVLVGCGSNSSEPTASNTPKPEGAGGAVQKGNFKTLGGFSATAAGQNPESHLGSK
jgi:PBP1b-binding outer membrane lipoprotein LpoB